MENVLIVFGIHMVLILWVCKMYDVKYLVSQKIINMLG